MYAVNMAVTDTIQEGLLENFRPRSKSDTTRSSGGIRRPNFLSHLKGGQRRSVQVSVVGGGVQHSQLSEIQENQTSESQEKPQESDNNDTVSPLLEKEQPGEFRTRASSAGHQARAHVSKIVARIKNRSNSSASLSYN